MHIKSIEDWADLATIAFDSVRNTVAAQTFPFLSRAGVYLLLLLVIIKIRLDQKFIYYLSSFEIISGRFL